MELDLVRDTLEKAGFTQYEADAYLTLVRKGATSATEVAETSGVPKSRIYDVLRDLERKGLVETYKQNSLQARALDPDSIISDLRSRAESFTDTADELKELWSAPALGEHDVTLVKRLETVTERAVHFIRSAEIEIQLAISPSQFHELRPFLLEAHNRDVFIKLSITSTETPTDELDQRFDFDGVATEVSLRDLSVPFLTLVDRSKICFSPQPGSGYQFGIVANNHPLAYVFHWYFEASLWEPWEIVYTTRDTEPPITYVNIRRCVVDVAPLYHEGADITVTATGLDTETGEEKTVTGTIVDLVYTGSTVNNRYPSLSEVSGQVSIFIDDGKEIYGIGGRFAQIEDLELSRLTIDSISL
ncbi:TrmB family transcriptional regulator [Halegenticoccus tardaugens]|uniref:TrmB family transcriptional regulator n=1 Tax=Halegenticoccus tardaugens TaxID=2071624 RepID=UPI00100C1BD9|nr:TrmB family transcriptional regulator [Halegenticoccus tardaugens]